MDIVEFVMAVENEFGIAIPNDVAPNLGRVGDLYAFVVRALGPSADPAAVWERLKKVVVEYCPVSEDQVVPEAHVIDDFGMD